MLWVADAEQWHSVTYRYVDENTQSSVSARACLRDIKLRIRNRDDLGVQLL